LNLAIWKSLEGSGEPSAGVGFAGNPLDRRAESRGQDAAADALAEPGARVLFLQGAKLWLKPRGEAFEPFFTPAEALALEGGAEHILLLGWDEHGPVLAFALAADGAGPEGAAGLELRPVYSGALLPRAVLGMVAQGAALANWHGNNGFCARCGHRSELCLGGVKRVCPQCGAEHFPRTDPVAIMLAAKGEKCLLGRGKHFLPGMFSCLAGFIEPGETIEDAVRRETFEESGIRLGAVRYHASQPWPFPHSLMIGCIARALDDEVRFDESELEACRWFLRDEVRTMLAGSHPEGLRVPPPAAIATHLIQAWAEG
jgi:NAD+ diphosphatase